MLVLLQPWLVPLYSSPDTGRILQYLSPLLCVTCQMTGFCTCWRYSFCSSINLWMAFVSSSTIEVTVFIGCWFFFFFMLLFFRFLPHGWHPSRGSSCLSLVWPCSNLITSVLTTSSHHRSCYYFYSPQPQRKPLVNHYLGFWHWQTIYTNRNDSNFVFVFRYSIMSRFSIFETGTGPVMLWTMHLTILVSRETKMKSS